MLKWTLRNSSDAPTPPLPDVRYQVRHAEVKLNLKDSNKCWLETQVKVAQVRSTSKIAGTAKENEVLLTRENGNLFQEKENESIFRRLISPSHSHADDDKKRRRHHKHYRNSSCRCNPLDPLRLFSGEVTDSDTGSVYMRLEHTPVALQPRPQVVATTGLNDPRRKPLCDISNGDYSDLRKHLQCISSSSHLHYHHHHPNSQELPHYLQRFAAPAHARCHATRDFSDHFQQRCFPPPPRPDPLGASDSQSNLNLDPRRRSRSSSRSRSRSSSAPRSLPLTAVNSSLLEGSTITSTSSHSISARGVAEGKSQSMIHEGQCPEVHSYCLKRHSIADIPTEASFRGVWQIQKERRGRSSSHERKKENTYERVRSPKHFKDRRKEKEEAKEEGRGKTPRERVEGRRASRTKVKGEPIYEKIDNGDTSETTKTNSGSSLNSKNSYNSFDNAVYMSMKDLRERCNHDKSDGYTCQQEHLYSSLHMRISPDPNKTPVHMHDHLYENMLYLPMTEVKSVIKKPMDLNRPLPDPPSFDDAELDSTCDFTSEPQKDIHKPVAIKISNDLIARFGKSPNDRQQPMPQYGLYIAAQPSKKPCKIEDCHQSNGQRSQIDKPGKVYKSTGQHIHINYSHGKNDDPSIPLHNLRPPPPPPPRKSRSNQGSTKTKTKSKGSTKPKLDIHLPVIYENTRQEEELVHSAKKRKLRHRMEIEFSFDDEDRHLNRSSEEASVSGSSPRGHNTSSSDNPDSGVSEGVNSPLVSPLSAPRSPQTPRSDSLLEEPCTPLTMDELHGCNKSPRESTSSKRNSNIYANLSHDMTDPRFLSLLRDSGQLSHSITEAYIDDLFHQVNQQVLQQSLSSISASNFETTCRSYDQLESPIPSKSVDLSKMLLSAVGRNLFSDSTKVSTPGREAKTHSGDTPNNSSSSLSRRHSFSSLADISRRLSKIEFNDDTTSLWGMEVSDHDTSPSLKKTKSLQCLDLSFKSPIIGSVPLMDSMAEILKDPEEISFSFPASKSQELSHDKMYASPKESVHSGQWWSPGDGGGGGGGGYWNEDGSEEENGKSNNREGRTGEVFPTEGSGKRAGGGQAAQPGSFSELPSSHDRHPISSQPSITPASHRSPTSNPTLPLPVMSRGQHLGMGRESASASSSSSCYSVPLGPPSCEEENSSLLDLSQCVSGCGGDSTILTLDNSGQLTARQQRRQEESSYRLQRMLQDRSRSPQEHEQDESVSADWSMEAVLDEASTFEHHDLDVENNDSPESASPESQDAISLYTLGSEFADSIYISPKLCEKIKEVSEEKMLARLRKSFRSKKDKASSNGQVTNNNNSGSSKPKVGILMFVDNPMYLSPEVKKEAKVVSSQQQNSVWYVGNPMYNSPDPNKLRNLNYDTKQRAICEKENQRNARLAKVICQNNNLRKPLGSLWLQSNPCYYSPDVKNPSSSNPNNKNSISVNNNNNTNNPNHVQRTFVREKPEDHYLTPISVKPTRDIVLRPSVVPLDELNDGDILDLQKFIDHEYCTIPGDESDSWVSQSTSRKSDSPIARRTLEFGNTKKQRDDRNSRSAKKPITPSRIWRQTGKNQHSTPRKYQGTLEKSLDTGASLGTRVHRTPRAVKRGKKSREAKEYRGNSPTPPPLPARPHPGHHHYVNERTLPQSRFEDTSDFHRQVTNDLDDSTKFQLPPDSVYESITFLQGKSEKKLPAEWVAQSRILDRAPPTGLSSCVRSSACSSSSSFRNCSRKGVDSVRRSASCMSSFSSGAKNGVGPGSLSEGSLKARSARKCTSTRKVTKKYRARDVLQGKGQLKLAVYENYGLLTIHIIEAKKLRSRLSSVCNPYVKISLVPDTEERTFCRTPLVRATNAPQFDQKFSFDFLPEDLDKRLLVSVWSRDTLRKRSEFLGCMSFSISHISTKRVHGWFRLLTETLGRRKHFAVSFLNASHDTTRNKMEEVLILDDRTSTTSTHDNEREPLYSTLEHHQGVPLPNQNVNQNELVGNSPRKATGQTPYTITVCISKGNQGYGFSVKWTKPPRVERVEPGLAADRAGLKPGDYVIFIGEHNVVKYDENTVLQIIRECGETLIMEVYRRGVTKVPRGLANGFANRTSVSESVTSNESHPRKRLSHITFNSETGVQDRQNIIYSLINCEQAFSNACRFGLERYFIPLKFRTDLITQAQHAQLFNNMDQLVDMSDSVVDSLMGNDDDEGIGDNVGFNYYQMVDEMAENYSKYFRGLPEADKLLSHKLHEIDFKDFLLTPQIPRKKPDITTFIHKPAEHIRELVGLLTKLYSSSPGQKDNTYLDTVLDRLKACYRGMTSQQNIMEPTPPMSPTGIAGNALRPPLVSVSDIEQRLVFTKYTQPFRLHDNRRQWVFGGELHKFEGRNLKQYWVMLFTDLLLFTKINRDRVIFVMEDPVPLTAVLHAVFTVKKKATEFRLIIDSTVKVPGSSNSYMTLPKTQRATKKKKNHNTVTLGRENKRTLVLRAPSLELKATWSNLIQRQLYVCQQLPSPPSLYGKSAPSLGRAVSTDGLHSPPTVGAGRFSCSVGDLRPGDDTEVVELNDVRPKPAQRVVFKSSKIIGINRRDRVEEIELGFEDGPETEEHLPSHQGRAAIPSSNGNPVANHSQVFNEDQDDLILNIHDEGRERLPSNAKRYGKSKSSKVKQKGGRSRKGGKHQVRTGEGVGGGGYAEEVVLRLSDSAPRHIIVGSNDPSQMSCALYNHSDSQECVPNIVVTQNEEDAGVAGIDPLDDDEDADDEFVIEDVRTGTKSYLDPKKKGIRSKVKDKLFPNRHLPTKKKIDRTKKVEKFVDSIMIEDLNHAGRVTPVFDREEYLTYDDFTQKRNTLLQNHPKNFMEGDTEIITLDFPTTSAQTPMSAELVMELEKKQLVMKRKEDKKKGLTLEGIEEESPDHASILQKPIISPEAYEDYIGESVENDYPELAGGSDFQNDNYDDLFAQREQELYEEEQRRLQLEQEEYELQQKEELLQQQEEMRLQEMLEQQRQEELRLQEEEEELLWQQQQQQQQQELEQNPTGPLSGSASMSFMDEHSPTSNGNCDFYRQCIAKTSRDLSQPVPGNCSVECNFGEFAFCGKDDYLGSIKANFVNRCAVDNQLRTSCSVGNSSTGGDKTPKRTISLGSSTSASGKESRNNSTSTSEHSSMSISTCSVSSNAMSVKKNRSYLFLPTSTTSLPEISIEPPTPQAPKPKDNFDRENKIKYDLRIPGYRSMFLTVPGFDDDDGDRYLPRYSCDSNDEEESSSDDDVVHKPRVFASLAGMAENQRLRRYGSSCDIAQFGICGESTSNYGRNNDFNANTDASNRKSKVGGTGSGAFVADKLAVFERVVEEEHRKFIESQEVRKRIFRQPKKSGEYLDKFYNPQVIENIDARASVRSRKLRYYDDVFDSDDNPRSPTPNRACSPPSRALSPPSSRALSPPPSRALSPPTSRALSPPTHNLTGCPSGYRVPEPPCISPQPRSNVILSYSSEPSEPPRSPSPLPMEDDYDVYGYVGGYPKPSSPGPAYGSNTTRQCSPEPQPHTSENYRPIERVSSPGPSHALQADRVSSLDKQTDEVMEMLDNSYLDMNDLDTMNGPTIVKSDNSAKSSNYDDFNKNAPSSSSMNAPDSIDDVFEIEDADDNLGSSTSVGRGGHKRKAAPAPPPPNNTSAPSENKLGGFFNRVRKDKDKEKDADRERMKKNKEKKDNKAKEKPAGKRFQLFGGAKKANEPGSAEGATEENSPKKDKKEEKGKRRLFGRGKENFLGRSPNVSHKSDQQAAKMTSPSIDQDSFEFDDDAEIL